MSVDPTHQLVILARLSEFCQYRGRITQHEQDPWDFMLRKLTETREPLTGLKAGLFELTKRQVLEESAAGPLDKERCADYRLLFERLLSPGDFADVAIHLFPGAPGQDRALSAILGHVRPTTLFDEEGKADGERSPAWDKLVAELSRRLDIDRFSTILVRKPMTRRRKAMVLRRLRRNVAEYCCVVRIPTDPKETFTPFILPRIEALIAACLRFLRRYR